MISVEARLNKDLQSCLEEVWRVSGSQLLLCMEENIVSPGMESPASYQWVTFFYWYFDLKASAFQVLLCLLQFSYFKNKKSNKVIAEIYLALSMQTIVFLYHLTNQRQEFRCEMLQEKPNFKQLIHKTRMYETLPVQAKIELQLELLSNFLKANAHICKEPSASICQWEKFSLFKLLKLFQDSCDVGDPGRQETIGETQLPYSVFLDYILSLAETKFK